MIVKLKTTWILFSYYRTTASVYLFVQQLLCTATTAAVALAPIAYQRDERDDGQYWRRIIDDDGRRATSFEY